MTMYEQLAEATRLLVREKYAAQSLAAHLNGPQKEFAHLHHMALVEVCDLLTKGARTHTVRAPQ